MGVNAEQHDLKERAVEREDLAGALADLARRLQRARGSQATLEQVVRTAIALVPGAEEGSISVVAERREVTSWAASDELPRRIDALQSELGQGPCLDAVFEHEVVRVPDVAAERRWPTFGKRAAELGAGSMLAFQLYVTGDDLGAMNLYARSTGAFDEESELTGLPLAAHAAVALARVQERDQLTQALRSRNVIGQAQGILMERHKLSADQAFELLTTVSQHRNVKLRDVADELVHSGQLKGPRGTV